MIHSFHFFLKDFELSSLFYKLSTISESREFIQLHRRLMEMIFATLKVSAEYTNLNQSKSFSSEASEKTVESFGNVLLLISRINGLTKIVLFYRLVYIFGLFSGDNTSHIY